MNPLANTTIASALVAAYCVAAARHNEAALLVAGGTPKRRQNRAAIERELRAHARETGGFKTSTSNPHLHAGYGTSRRSGRSHQRARGAAPRRTADGAEPPAVGARDDGPGGVGGI